MITLEETVLRFPNMGKHYSVVADFSAHGIFADRGFQARLHASDASYVIAPNHNLWNRGVAAWTVYIPTNAIANYGLGTQAVFQCEIFGAGWEGSISEAVPAAWEGPTPISWGTLMVPLIATGQPPINQDAVRIWEPLASPPQLDPNGVGIGVVNFNRRETMMECVRSVIKYTQSPYYLVVADDGSADGSASWARESGIPVITGRNWGPARNKNRALAYLMRETQCDTFILLEEDCHPCDFGWERDWVEAARRYPQMNYSTELTKNLYYFTGSGTLEDPFWGPIQSAQVTSLRRKVVEEFGYMDPRFGKWGEEHVEWSFRVFGKKENPDGILWPAMVTGVACVDSVSGWDPEEQIRSEYARAEMRDDPPYRLPYYSGLEHKHITEVEHDHELRRATWPLRAEVGKEGLVSIIVPTRNRKLARRLYESIGEHDQAEFIWVWNGVGSLDLPGIVVEYPRLPFIYEEAVNRGAMASKGEILWLMNDDVTVKASQVIDKILRAYTAQPKVAVGYGSRAQDEPEGCEFLIEGDPLAPSFEGGCWTIRRKAFCEMGGLEESITEYGGDELVTAVRMARLGWRGAMFKGLASDHIPGATYGETSQSAEHLVQCGYAIGWKLNPAAVHREHHQYRSILESEALSAASRFSGGDADA